VAGELCVLVLAVVVLATAAQTPGEDDAAAPATLSETDRLLAENHRLRVTVAELTAQLADLRARLDGQTLTAERADLVERFRRRLGAPPDAVFDWGTLSFAAPAPPAEEP
jgi:hypothetical protein